MTSEYARIHQELASVTQSLAVIDMQRHDSILMLAGLLMAPNKISVTGFGTHFGRKMRNTPSRCEYQCVIEKYSELEQQRDRLILKLEALNAARSGVAGSPQAIESMYALKQIQNINRSIDYLKHHQSRVFGLMHNILDVDADDYQAWKVEYFYTIDAMFRYEKRKVSLLNDYSV